MHEPDKQPDAAPPPTSPEAGHPGTARSRRAEISQATRGRRTLVAVLLWGTTLLAVVGIFAVWANREMLNPDNWSSTSTQLLQNAAVREATANYLVEQLYANVDVEQELKARLPAQIQPLAGPLAGALHN